MAGEHLDAFFGNAQKAIELLPSLVHKAYVLPVLPEQEAHNSQHKDQPSFHALVYPDAPAAFLALVKINTPQQNNELARFYPFLRDGAPHVLEILDLKPGDDETEGIIETVNHNAVTVSFYDPTFACHRRVYAKGRKFEFSIAALAYCLEKVEDTNIKITEGPMLELNRQRLLTEDPTADVSKITSVDVSMAELRTILPRDNGADAEFQTVVEGVEYFTVEGTEICKMPVILMHPDDEDFRAVLYATEHVLKGYRPQIGDSIRGVLWLQGYPLRPVEDPTNWSDRLTPASPQYDMEAIRRVFDALDYLSDQHPGVTAVGATCAREGWDVTKYANPSGSSQVPAFLIERHRHKAVNVWVRAHIVDQEPSTPFTPAEIASYGKISAERDQNVAFVTVTCTETGKGHTFKTEGLETLEQHIGKVNLLEFVAKPEFRKPIEIPSDPGAPTEGPPGRIGPIPSDRVHPIRLPEDRDPRKLEACRAYARMMNRLEASHLEPWLAEDLQYSSQWVENDLHGKDAYLQYLRGKLAAIQRSGDRVWAQVAYTDAFGAGPCVVLSQSAEHNLTATLLLDLRDGKISRMTMCSIPSPHECRLTGEMP